MPLEIIATEIPYRPSADYYQAVRAMQWPIWLDSGRPKQDRGQYDIISANPSYTLSGNANQYTLTETRSGHAEPVNDLWNCLRQHLQDNKVETNELPFSGGWMGSLGYDLGLQLENIPVRRSPNDDPHFQHVQLGFYDWAIIQDHEHKKSQIVSFHHSVDLETIHSTLINAHSVSADSFSDSHFHCTPFTSQTDANHYLSCIERIQEYIRAGDCYQVNYAQNFSAHCQGDSLEAYLRLRETTPAQFSCLFETDQGAIMSLSPERFLELKENEILTQPIKGTAPRSDDFAIDKNRAIELISSEKNRAENLMIVDLLRNDLSKVSQPYSVKTPKLFDLESYANVHHLVSSVTAILKEGADAVELLKASFPGGSITGAPKKRAIEIIEELEDTPRNVYCGSIGYLSCNGHMDTNIAIRTLLRTGDTIFCWGGGGIVADSDPQQEYQESLDKVGVLMRCLESNTAPPAETE